jgi:hypothetical protein
MNILLWTLQILLAFWNIVGGLYTLSNYEQLKSSAMGELPHPLWVGLCVLQILFALCLILPGVLRRFHNLVPLAAIYLAINSLLGCALFAKYAGFPGLLWGVIPAIFAVFVAYGRVARKQR